MNSQRGIITAREVLLSPISLTDPISQYLRDMALSFSVSTMMKDFLAEVFILQTVTVKLVIMVRMFLNITIKENYLTLIVK